MRTLHCARCGDPIYVKSGPYWYDDQLCDTCAGEIEEEGRRMAQDILSRLDEGPFREVQW